MEKSAEIQREQEYFDLADEYRELMKIFDPSGASDPKGAIELRRAFEREIAHLGGSNDPVALGRIDLSDDGTTFYVGRAKISAPDSEVVVISMKAPKADPFYTATAADPKGLARKRTFETTGNRLDDFSDLVFAELVERLERLIGIGDLDQQEMRLDDALLRELGRSRSGEMADIARTIQASQHSIITSPKDQVLILQGGPGTGKTAVALHRLSWMLYRHQDEIQPSEVLVVGPNPTFVRYIRRVLPGLGDRDVAQMDINAVCKSLVSVTLGREESQRVTEMKGEARMAALLRAGMRERIGANPDATYEIPIGRNIVRFTPARLNEMTASLAGLPYASGREQMRRLLDAEINRQAYGFRVEVPRLQLDQFVDRVWPQLTERAFLRELFGSQNRLVAAAGDLFTATEVSLLVRSPAPRINDEIWSDADLALLDEARWLIDPPAPTYKHIVVDEAQDLSPMQLRALKRRAAAPSMTVVGDIAQSTGLWSRDSWKDIQETLDPDGGGSVEVLDLGYRVPHETFSFAARLLPIAAPGFDPPRAVRLAGHEPNSVLTSQELVSAEAVRLAKLHSANGNFVGIICPDRHWEATVHALNENVDRWTDARSGDLGVTINLVSPAAAKGLEFDAVVVVDPQAIVDEDPRGHRLLYIALTRTTTYLDIVHTGVPLPGVDEPPPEPPAPPDQGQPAPPPTQVSRVVEAVAGGLAADIRDGVKPEQWQAVLARLQSLLFGEGTSTEL